MKNRVEWIDIAKFWGIFAIYLGHFGESAGLAYQFVFAFHVPLFFFISGSLSNLESEKNLLCFIWKKFRGIMVPFYCFALISIGIFALENNTGISNVKELLIIVGKGCIRNSFIAGSLWFLSCLFVMEVFFKLLSLLKKRIVILAVSLVLFLTAVLFIEPCPIVEPHWAYNIDSMLYYLVFYVLGYCLYPCISSLFALNTTWKKVCYALLFLISSVYTVFLFGGTAALSKLPASSFTNIVIQLLQPLICIFFVFALSRLLEGVKYLPGIGRETLYLCGNEYVIKTLAPLVLSLFGITVTVDNPLKVYVYSLILLAVNDKLVIPAEKSIANLIKGKLFPGKKLESLQNTDSART